MNIEFKLLPPMMPNFISYEMPPSKRQDGIKFDNKISVADLTEQQAIEYGELMKQSFIKHWQSKVINK